MRARWSCAGAVGPLAALFLSTLALLVLVMPSRAHASGWDTPVVLDAPLANDTDAQQTNPIFDSAGNAWVFLFDTFAPPSYSIKVRHSSGHDNVWSSPELLTTGPDFFYAPTMAIDPQDRITLVYRAHHVGTGYELIALRYLPGTGWLPAQSVLRTSESFQSVHAAADTAGNVVVTLDAPSGTAMSSLVYVSASDTWGELTRISPPDAQRVDVTTLVANRAHTAIYAAYFVTWDSHRSIQVRRFRTSTLDWDAALDVPGTANGLMPTTYGAGYQIPAVVDDDGVLTVPYYVRIQQGGPAVCIFRAVRLQASGWTAPVSVLKHADPLPLLADYAAVDYSAGGDVMYLFNLQPHARLMALHYRASNSSWDAPVTLDVGPIEDQFRNQISFRADGSALATYKHGSDAFISRVFDGSEWSPEVIPVRGQPRGDYKMAANGDDVLLLNSTDLSNDGNSDVLASWFRAQQP